MTGQVQGKVALVTGGASGIGEAVSELLAREGASVAVTDVDDLKGPEVVARIKKAGHEAHFWQQDVTSEERWIEVVAEVMQRYGRLDVLVSNAGIGISVPSITEMSLADWRRQTAINLDGVFLSVKHCLPLMRNLQQVQTSLGDRLGKDARIISISVDPTVDTPPRLKEYAKKLDAKPGWYFLTGEKESVEFALKKLGQFVENKQDHMNIFIIGNDRTGLWKKAFGLAKSEEIVKVVDSVINDQVPAKQ